MSSMYLPSSSNLPSPRHRSLKPKSYPNPFGEALFSSQGLGAAFLDLLIGDVNG